MKLQNVMLITLKELESEEGDSVTQEKDYNNISQPIDMTMNIEKIKNGARLSKQIKYLCDALNDKYIEPNSQTFEHLIET